MKKNMYMMLMLLAVGSMSSVEATCKHCQVTESKIFNNDDSFLHEMHSIERCIHSIREHAQSKSVKDSLAALDELSTRVDALEKATTEENVTLQGHRIDKLRHKISHARSYVNKHGIRS